jgi:hypothetical protein
MVRTEAVSAARYSGVGEMNNQPAFPSPYDDQEGMTLRDYFAAKAMVAYWADPNTASTGTNTAAAWAYDMADAMLKAREQ